MRKFYEAFGLPMFDAVNRGARQIALDIAASGEVEGSVLSHLSVAGSSDPWKECDSVRRHLRSDELHREAYIKLTQNFSDNVSDGRVAKAHEPILATYGKGSRP